MTDITQLGGPYATVFDVGGSIGNFAAACHLRWPQARIYSFEPLADVAARNRDVAAGRWETFTYGLAERDGLRPINRNIDAPEASTLLRPGTVRSEAFGAFEAYVVERASFRTLDWIVQELGVLKPPALLKIDVEGAELLVLEGGRRSLPLFETVVIELNSQGCFVGSPAPDQVDGILREHGFRLRGRAGELRDPRDGKLLQWDDVWARL